jgi:hypothetical protein
VTEPQESVQQSSQQQLTAYLDKINAPDFNVHDMTLERLCKLEEYSAILPLFERLFCVPATSAPVERVFSQSGLIMRPHRARMSDSLLETMMFLKCNSEI